MAARKPVEPWPLWGRVLAIALIVAVLVAVAVAALSDGFHPNGAGLRIFVAAVTVPALLVVGVTQVLGRRLERLDERLVSGVLTAAASVRAELSLPPDQRTTGVPDDRLRQAANLLDRARRGLEAGSRPEAVAAAERLRVVTDAWAQDSEVTRSVASVGATARSLRRTQRSLDQQRR